MSKNKPHIIYRLDNGDRVPGVTTIVGVLDKPALLAWANRIGLEGIEMRKFVDDKADIGTLGHQMIVDYLSGLATNTSDYSENQIKQARWACNSFYAWMENHKVKLVWAEKPLVSEIHRYGGTMDIYASIDGVNELVDIKTGGAIYDEHRIQVAGGYLTLMQENKLDVQKIRILNVPRVNNEVWGEVVLLPDQWKLYQDMFLACLNVYNLKKQMRGETIYPSKKNAKRNPE